MFTLNCCFIFWRKDGSFFLTWYPDDVSVSVSLPLPSHNYMATHLTKPDAPASWFPARVCVRVFLFRHSGPKRFANTVLRQTPVYRYVHTPSFPPSLHTKKGQRKYLLMGTFTYLSSVNIPPMKLPFMVRPVRSSRGSNGNLAPRGSIPIITQTPQPMWQEAKAAVWLEKGKKLRKFLLCKEKRDNGWTLKILVFEPGNSKDK